MAEVQAPIVGGHVYCRVRHGDIDITTCLACDRLLAVHDRTSPPYLVCQVDDVDLAAPDQHFVEWWYQHHRRGR